MLGWLVSRLLLVTLVVRGCSRFVGGGDVCGDGGVVCGGGICVGGVGIARVGVVGTGGYVVGGVTVCASVVGVCV